MKTTKLLLAALLLGCAQSAGIQSSAPATAGGAIPAPEPFARFPVEVVNNHVYVKGFVGAQSTAVNLILDTGAGASFLDLDVAKSLGIQLGRAGTARGAGPGATQTAAIEPTSVLIPGSGVTVQVRGAIALAGVSRGEGLSMQGILGYDFIAPRVVAIDYRNRELRLYDAKSFRYTGAGASVPLIMEVNHPHIMADVLFADGGRATGKFIVDVGAAPALAFAKPFVDKHRMRDRVGPTIRARAGGGVGGVVTADIGRVAALQIGPYKVESPVTQLHGDSAGVFSGGIWDGNIGGEVLRRFTIYFDYSRKQMILEPHQGTSEPFEADMGGGRFRADADLVNFTVVDVVAQTPAAEAGLMVGDRVLLVDGVAPVAGTLMGLRQRLRRPGERVSLTVQRGDARVDVQFTTRRII